MNEEQRNSEFIQKYLAGEEIPFEPWQVPLVEAITYSWSWRELDT